MMNSVASGLNHLVGFDYRIQYVPLWCTTEGDYMLTFEAYIELNKQKMNEIDTLEDFRSLISLCLKATDVSILQHSAGGIPTCGAPLYLFVQRWNSAVTKLQERLQNNTLAQVIDATIADINGDTKDLFKNHQLLTTAIVLCTRDGKDFSDLFKFAGVVTFGNHFQEEVDVNGHSAHIPRIMNISKRGGQSMDTSRLNISEEWCPQNMIGGPYVVFAAVPVAIDPDDLSKGSLTRLELFYWCDTVTMLENIMAELCRDKTYLPIHPIISDEPGDDLAEKRQKYYRSDSLMPATQFRGAFQIIAKKLHQQPMEGMRFKNNAAPFFNIHSTNEWIITKRHAMTEYTKIMEQQYQPQRAQPLNNNALLDLDPNNEWNNFELLDDFVNPFNYMEDTEPPSKRRR